MRRSKWHRQGFRTLSMPRSSPQTTFLSLSWSLPITSNHSLWARKPKLLPQVKKWEEYRSYSQQMWSYRSQILLSLLLGLSHRLLSVSFGLSQKQWYLEKIWSKVSPPFPISTKWQPVFLTRSNATSICRRLLVILAWQRWFLGCPRL